MVTVTDEVEIVGIVEMLVVFVAAMDVEHK